MAREAIVLPLVALLLTVGCVGALDDDEQIEQQSLPGQQALDRVLAHTPTDLVELPPEAEALTVRVIDTGYDASEPTLGVLSDGTIVSNPVTDDQSLIMSEDHGQTWETIGSPVHNPKANLDPWMFVDHDTDRIFNGPLYVACSWLAWTDDKGESWMSNPIAGCGLPAHDHQKITAGPPAEGVSTDGYPNVIYYAYNGAFRGGLVDPAGAGLAPDTLDGTWVSTSLDGGQTFTNAVKVFEPSSCKSGINGPVHVADDGMAYIAHPTCEGVAIARSFDSGASWDPTGEVTDMGMYGGLAVDVDISSDAAGNVYVHTPGGDGRGYVIVSQDRGNSWSDPIPVTPPGVNMTVFPLVSAGATGNVAFAYLGTTDDVSTWDRPEPSHARVDADWHLYLTTTEDMLADEPVLTTVQVTPDDDPVQRGCIWLKGGSSECRNLLDFNEMVLHDGRPYITYTDGCDACPDGEQSTDDLHRIAILEQGPSLLDGTLSPLVELAGNATPAS